MEVVIEEVREEKGEVRRPKNVDRIAMRTRVGGRWRKRTFAAGEEVGVVIREPDRVEEVHLVLCCSVIEVHNEKLRERTHQL